MTDEQATILKNFVQNILLESQKTLALLSDMDLAERMGVCVGLVSILSAHLKNMPMQERVEAFHIIIRELVDDHKIDAEFNIAYATKYLDFDIRKTNKQKGVLH